MFPLVSKNFFKFFLGVYSQEKVQRTVDAMKQRRDNLIWVKCRKLRYNCHYDYKPVVYDFDTNCDNAQFNFWRNYDHDGKKTIKLTVLVITAVIVTLAVTT